MQTVPPMRLLVAFLLLTLAGCRKGTEAPAVVPPPPASIADGGTGVAVPAAPDAGAVDAGPPDAGPDPHSIGGLGSGPFSADPLVIYGSGQGLLEPPISASVDEAENLWVVSHDALYLMAPRAKVFRRYTAQDGLHYGSGYTESPTITLVEGGADGECCGGY